MSIESGGYNPESDSQEIPVQQAEESLDELPATETEHGQPLEPAGQQEEGEKREPLSLIERHKQWREDRWVTRVDRGKVTSPALYGMALGGGLFAATLLSAIRTQPHPNQHSTSLYVGGMVSALAVGIGGEIVKKIAERRANTLHREEHNYPYAVKNIATYEKALEGEKHELEEINTRISDTEARIAEAKSSQDERLKYVIMSHEGSLKQQLKIRRIHEKSAQFFERTLNKSRDEAAKLSKRMESRVGKEESHES